MKVLAFGCHPDDIEVACAGTMAKYVKEGHEVVVCHVANGNLGHAIIKPDELREMRAEEAKKAGRLAGIRVITCDIGDVMVYSEDKAQREMQAADKLFAILPEKDAKEIRELWLEFEAQETPDAKFCASLDRIQPLVNNILTDGHTWRKGKVNRAQVEKRASVIEHGFPNAWQMVCDVIDEAEETGYFKHE